MKSIRALAILLALLLLNAQHAALSHQIAHLANHGLPPAEQQLCGQHDALGTVAGALDGVLPEFDLPGAPQCASVIADLPAANLCGLAPSSRGPPSLS